jgi:hypothetical protein
MNKKKTRKLPILATILALLAVDTFSPATLLAEETRADRWDKYVYRRIIDTLDIMSKRAPHEWTNFLPGSSSSLGASIEVGIMYLYQSNTSLSKRYLAHLNLVYLGSANSEALGCAITEKGKEMLAYLNSAKLSINQNICLLPEAGLKGRKKFCASKEDAERKIDGLIAIINAGNKCEANW